MKTQVRTQETTGLSSFDRALGACLVAASIFVLSYTATRVFLGHPTGAVSEASVVPHQAELWADFGPQ